MRAYWFHLSSLLLICVTCLHGQQESLKIGAGDEVQIKVLEAPELEETARVEDSGMVHLMLGGDIRLAGLSPSQAAAAVGRALIDSHVVLVPHVTVSLLTAQSSRVTVMGQVRTPGTFEIDTRKRLSDVLSMAGGLTELADREIRIRRVSGAQMAYYVTNDPTHLLDSEPMIDPGDTIIVPRASIVYLLGTVGRPGGYPMSTNDSKLTMLQALALAGGIPPNGSPAKARLIRKRGNVYVEIPVNLVKLQKGRTPDFVLQADDIVYVPFSYARNTLVGVNSLISAAASASIYHF